MIQVLTPQDITESLEIEQDNKKYLLYIKIQGEILTLNVSEPVKLEIQILLKN